MFAQHQVAAVIENMKNGLNQKLGVVSTDTIEDFDRGFSMMAAATKATGIKLYDELGEIRIMESVPRRLRTHGIVVVELEFPDGERWEMVTRFRETTNQIYTFAYKL